MREHTWRLLLIPALCLGAAGSASAADPARYEPGQVWRYHTRPGEEDSRAVVGLVEEADGVGRVVHIKLTGVAIKSAAAQNGLVRDVSHVPMRERALSASVTSLESEDGNLDGFREGYEAWLRQPKQGRGGFSQTLSEVVALIQAALNR